MHVHGVYEEPMVMDKHQFPFNYFIAQHFDFWQVSVACKMWNVWAWAFVGASVAITSEIRDRTTRSRPMPLCIHGCHWEMPKCRRIRLQKNQRLPNSCPRCPVSDFISLHSMAMGIPCPSPSTTHDAMHGYNQYVVGLQWRNVVICGSISCLPHKLHHRSQQQEHQRQLYSIICNHRANVVGIKWQTTICVPYSAHNSKHIDMDGNFARAARNKRNLISHFGLHSVMFDNQEHGTFVHHHSKHYQQILIIQFCVWHNINIGKEMGSIPNVCC